MKMYTCGPSTYLRPHIGNYRTFLFEDILQHYLEYLGYKVTRLMTLTDVEDKAIAEARKENVTVEELTSRNEVQFFKDFNLLKIKVPDYTVRASSVIPQSVRLINSLLTENIAYYYTHEGRRNIYFDPSKFKGFGKLAHLDMTKWPVKKRRFHKDTYPGTPWNRGDFIIWHDCKQYDANDVCWDTEIGRGRPAWNIQDAAIVTEHLGFQIDIAAGGIDNLVRHHDYTLAVAESVSGRPFANYWLHGAHLFMESSKMSKSKGNVIYPEDLIAKNYSSNQIRFFLIYGHYRKRINFTSEKFSMASQRLDEFKNMVLQLQELKKPESSASSEEAKNIVHNMVSEFENAMNNDLNVKLAFDSLFEAVSQLSVLRREAKLSTIDTTSALDALQKIDGVLKVIF
ncbi:MAG TPA: class I tRNA ligase family protein [Candidatus Sulfotelmatobacter sp.]|nr:class I tRNA ligase family protein [Candidatus Sulfotelmatobacter sp.]